MQAAEFFGAHSQPERRYAQNKEQNPKKLGAIRHAVRQTCEVMNAGSDAAEFKISLMLRRVARPARQ
jgi:hypothetical protein